MNNDRNQLDPPGFAPDNPTDNRKKGEWKTRYPKAAWINIVIEALYLAIIFSVTLCVTHNKLNVVESERLTICTDCLLEILTISWLGGTFGGVIFSIKWLYHSIAKNIWNEDRRLWRFFTPHISGALASAIILLVYSGIINIFNQESVHSYSSILGISFLTGYFSDAAFGKLSEIATTFFGATEKQSHQHQK